MRWPALIFLVLLLLLQYPLWFGKGGYLSVQQAEKQLATLKEENRKLEQRNAGNSAQVQDLKSGYDAIEERARFDLGLIKPGEKFVQIPDSPVGTAK